jgi:hypothetical protein
MASAIFLSSSVFFSSCIGSFTLSNKLLAWNATIDSKWVNELIFVILTPAYGVALFTDAIVLNSIEFWTGENPAKEVNVSVKQIKTENGTFFVTTHANGHTIQKAGSDEVVEFRFDKDAKSWNLIADEQTYPLLQFVEKDQVLVYLADGSTITLDSNQGGVMALRQIIENKNYLTVK